MNISGISTAQMPIQQAASTTQVQTQATVESSSTISDKMKELALAYILSASSEEKDTNPFLQMLLLSILFGDSEQVQTLTPDQQAQMINDIVSSGEPGAVARAMGQAGVGTYSAGGAMSAGAPIGSMVSTTA